MADDDLRQRLKEGFRQHRVTALVVGLLVVAAGLTAWFLWGGEEELPDGLVQANGRLEGDRMAVSSRVPGRVAEVLVDEGSRVRDGEILVRLEDDTVQARVDQAEESAAVVERRLEGARVALETLRREVPLEVDTARAAVRQAEAERERARAGAEQAERDAERFTTLAERGSVPARRGEEARTAAETARSAVAAADAAVETAERHLDRARLGRRQVESRERDVAALEAELAAARARAREARSSLTDLEIAAPTAGTVTEVLVDPGETLAAGSPVADLVDLDDLYLQAYVAEPARGRIALGDPARIHLDGVDEPVPGTVRFLASEAEFTPKEVQTPEQRVKLVYEVKIYLDENPGSRLTPGMPADAVIRWKEGVEWREPAW